MNSEFLASYRHQNFSLPDPIIFYIAKNATNPEIYQKLIKSCKYFFIKNPILVLSCLHYTNDGWKTCAFKTKKCASKENEMQSLDLENISSKIWITEKLDLLQIGSLALASLLSKMYLCQATACFFCQHSLTFNQLLSLSSAAEYCCFHECIVNDDIGDGSPLQIETVVANLPLLKKLLVYFSANAPNISSETVKELLKLPHFSNLKTIAFFNTPGSLDIKLLFEFLKKTTNVLLNVTFRDTIFEDYKTLIDAIIDEILETPSLTYRIPFLLYPAQNEFKVLCLSERYIKSNS